MLAELVLRSINASDDAFLRRLYGSTREAELSLMDWAPPARQAFIDMQFDARQRHHAQHFPSARRQIIDVDGQAVGRLDVLRGPQGWHLLDIALLPAFRGQGLGTLCLHAVLDEADAASLPIDLHVDTHNPARHWYERLGFVAAPASPDAPGPYLAMRRPSTGDRP